jgi:hypothetical protein
MSAEVFPGNRRVIAHATVFSLRRGEIVQVTIARRVTFGVIPGKMCSGDVNVAQVRMDMSPEAINQTTACTGTAATNVAHEPHGRL